MVRRDFDRANPFMMDKNPPPQEILDARRGDGDRPVKIEIYKPGDPWVQRPSPFVKPHR